MKKRYLIYICIVLLIVIGIYVPPVRPVIQLPGEVVVPWTGGLSFLRGPFANGLTNTFIATLLTFIILIALVLALRARSRTADEVPTGFYNFFEMVVEFAYGYVEGVSGKWAKHFFPWFMTIILWVVVANWMELVPMVDAVGKWENLPHFRAEQAVEAAEEEAAAEGIHLSEEEIHRIEEEVEHEVDEANVGDLRNGILLQRAPTGEDGEKPEDADWTIVPYVRAAATDLNFTLALAIISVVMTQYYGMRALGLGYWRKFFTWPADRMAKNPLALLDPAVGILEFISEVFKIVSFAFRLLGNIFAGQVLLFVMASLIPLANLAFWHLEFFVGILQALVFGLLTLIFMASATEGHHGEEH